MLKKVLQHVSKYPQNSSHPFLSENITILRYFLSFKLFVKIWIFQKFNLLVTYLTRQLIACLVYCLNNFWILQLIAIACQKICCFCCFVSLSSVVHCSLIFSLKNVQINDSFLPYRSSAHRYWFHNSRFQIKSHSYYYFITRTVTSQVIKIALLIAGIEPNPGPPLELTPNFEILTINCNGLTSKVRLLQAIGKIKKHIKNRQAIIFLQESHNADIALLESIWPGSVNVAIGTGGSKGVITIATNHFKLIAFKSDPEGRSLFSCLQFGPNHFINVANLYSPNNHELSKTFISNSLIEWDLFCQIQRDTNPPNSIFSAVIAGDLNCVIHDYDAQQRSRTKGEAALADVISSMMSERDMYDSVLRSSNGNNYTWNRGNTFSKLDYIFISSDLLDLISSYDTIWDLVNSDHAAIKIVINLNNATKRGRSYPKLFLSDLKSEGAVELIKQEICNAIKEFPSHWTPHQKLDFVKVVIRTNILEIRAKNKITLDSIELLRQELNFYNSIPTLNEQQSINFNSIRSELYKAEEAHSEKLRIMAGIKWAEEGERSTKFFLNAVNSKRANSTIDYLNSESGPIHNINDIVSISKNFYKDLYAARNPQLEEDFYKHCPKLSDGAKEHLGQDITIDDLRKALKSCKDSTPGLDGIPYSFYKIFGAQLLPILLDSWKYSTLIGSLPQSQSTSVISLIPKAGKDKHEIRNWRPISISPCDLKIITKALSIRVGTYLEEIICESQMGYVPGRDINFNNRIMRAALDHCKSNNLDYMLMSLDAQKAYDSIDHSYITNTLNAYGFPSHFISTVNLLHNNLQAQVQVNGFLSDRFRIERGVKQGDALSCALFIISIDPLIRNLENNSDIPALELAPNCTLKSMAYADDIAIFTPNNNNCLEIIFKEYERLTKLSGLMLNADKTEILTLSIEGKQKSRGTYN